MTATLVYQDNLFEDTIAETGIDPYHLGPEIRGHKISGWGALDFEAICDHVMFTNLISRVADNLPEGYGIEAYEEKDPP